jgi:nitrogen fixation NifU-like protein
MTELRELYQQIILDHNKNPRNFGKLEGANRVQEGLNPLCGDHLHVYLYLNDDRVIEDIRFEGSGCAISKASASLMSSTLKGQSADDAQKIFDQFHALVTTNDDDIVDMEKMGKLAVFAGVRDFPMRIKCATLAWHTMKAALDKRDDTVTTE